MMMMMMLHNIGQVHVGFQKVGRVRTRATRVVAAPMPGIDNHFTFLAICNFFSAQLYAY